LKEYLPEKSFVYLELNDFESDYRKIKEAIEGNLWEERFPYIKKAKNIILNDLQFFPRMERLLNNLEKN